MKYINYLCLGGLIVLLMSCGKDTCNSTLGDTFKQVELEKTEFNQTGNASITWSLETLADLPEAYFNDAFLNKVERDRFGEARLNSGDKVQNFIMDQTSLSISLNQEEAPRLGKSETYYFYFTLFDRINYIDCTHPGSADTYFLNLELEMQRINADSLAVIQFTWEEDYSAGGF